MSVRSPPTPFDVAQRVSSSRRLHVADIVRKDTGMRILVTGGTGHLGRAITARLSRDGHRVRVLARRPGDDSGVEWARGDLGGGADLRSALAGVDAVIHAATNSPAAQRGGFRPRDLFRSPTDVDIDGTTQLLAAAAEVPVQHFVHVSIVGLPQMAGVNPVCAREARRRADRGDVASHVVDRARKRLLLAAREDAREDGPAAVPGAAQRRADAAGRL